MFLFARRESTTVSVLSKCSILDRFDCSSRSKIADMASVPQPPVTFSGSLSSGTSASNLLRSSSNGINGVPLRTLGRGHVNVGRKSLSITAKVRKVKGKENSITMLLGIYKVGNEEVARRLLMNPRSIPSHQSLAADGSMKAHRKLLGC